MHCRDPSGSPLQDGPPRRSRSGPEVITILSLPEALQGPYGRYLYQFATTLLAAVPQLADLLVQPNWMETVVTPFLSLAEGEISEGFSSVQLEELHDTCEY
jgi:hypothetical protein